MMDPATKHTSVPRINQGQVTIIDAGPGSGKTTTIIESLARAANDWSIPPEQMLAVTFSREMAEELKSRCDDRDLTGIAASTLHAFCLGLLQEDPERFGATSKYEILGQREHSYLNKQYKRYFRLEGPIRTGLLIKAFHAHYERRTRVRDFLSEHRVSNAKIDLIMAFLKHYAKTKRRENMLGFHDMISLVLKAPKTDAGYRNRLRRRLKFLAVDEFQDMNAQERALVRLLARHIETVLIVGDDLQVVHTYRGARTDALQELKEQFPDARTISLNQSHRLTVESAAFVNKVLKQNGYDQRIIGAGHGPVPHMIAANSRNQMYRHAVREMQKLLNEGVLPEDIAVLARFRRSSETFARYLEHAAIPFTITGQSDRRHKLLLRFRRFLRAVIRTNHPKYLRILLRKEARITQRIANQLTDLTQRIPAEQLCLSKEQHQKVRKVRNAVQLTRDKPSIDRALHIFASAIQGRQDRFYLTPIQHVLRLERVAFNHATTLQNLLCKVDKRIRRDG